MNPPGPVQEYVTPDVGDPPVSTVLCVPHVTIPPLAVALGGLVFPVTLTVAVAVQPFELLITVTVYGPAVFTEGFCEVEVKPPGPVQEYVTPVAGVAFRFTDGAGQVMGPLTVAAGAGGVLFKTTVAVAVAEHPLELFVTATV